ncbi:MAG: hypothetical protein IT285_07250, partial [Bdellovibrionales bacterium]|nr:hypothetical protein [Bdellovibrionales bacterium]
MRGRVFGGALYLLVLASGCGGGIGDGQWATTMLEAFERDDGPFDLAGFLFHPGQGGDSLSIESGRLAYATSTTNSSILFLDREFERRSIRMTIEFRVGASQASWDLSVGLGMDSPDASPSEGVLCKFSQSSILLFHVTAGAGTVVDTGPS